MESITMETQDEDIETKNDELAVVGPYRKLKRE